MIEAPCGACGTLNRIAEADLPAGAKFVICSSCKSRVALPARALGGASAIKAPAVPAKAPALPKMPPPIPAPSTKSGVDLADLPAPKRHSALAGVGDAKPSPRSALADADLPAPKATSKPVAPPPELDALLPAPASAPKSAGLADLPAPKVKPLAKPEIPTKVGLADLPAPKRVTPPAGVAAVKPPATVPTVEDLPAPAAKRAAVPDLPAPAAKRATPPSGVATQPGIVDLPMPKAPDLPAPKPAAPDALDLPMPRADADLPSPKPTVDLPAPKGFFEDLPQPARRGGADLPAPKGFFEDLPQPARGGGADLPAPKGFFDDLPQPARSQPDVPAPKGFFDDLPQPSRAQSDVPAPKGFFDDLPPPTPAKPSGNLFDDLAAPDKPAPAAPASAAGNAIDLSALELDLGNSGPSLEIDLSPPPDKPPVLEKATDIDLGAPSTFGDLDLSPPTAKPVISIKTPAAKPAEPPPAAAPKSFAVAKQPADHKGSLELELEGDVRGTPAAIASAKKIAKKQQAAEESAGKQAAQRKRSRVVLGALLGVTLVGAGGFYMYQRHAKAQERAEQIEAHIVAARGSLLAADPHHWDTAQGEALAAIELDADNGQALGIAAEAMLGGALDTGVNGPARIAGARKKITDAIAAGHAGPELAHAQVLAAIAAGNADAALGKLQPMIASEPKNAMLQLYLGWAETAKGDTKAAIAAFDAAAGNAATKISALYGRGQAKLLAADLAGAKADFAAVLDDKAGKDHVGAMVGLAETLPASQASQREADLLAVLQRKDIAQADPRAVVLAWSMAADVARRDGRLDVARERYRKALAASPNDVGVLDGLAAVELRDGKLAVAADLIQKVLAQSKDDPIGQMELAELNIKQGKLPDAIALIKALADRVPPLPPRQHAQLMIVQGKLLEAQGQDDDAIEAYKQGAKDAGDLDLAPTMAAVEKLGQLAKKASDPAKADAYRAQADQLLSALAARAEEDAALSLTLGIAYLQAGDPGKAEGFLRRATEMRGNDIQAKLELAKALSRLDKYDDAIAQLKAALALDQARADIALELARTYEAAKLDDDAHKAYDALVANKDASPAARAYAGKFYARKGEIKKAAEQGDAILVAEPDNPAGHYLKGEGLLAAGAARWDDARKELAIAVDSDPDPQYLDAQGRIAEALAGTGETKYLDLALRAYGKATDADPKLVNAWAGQGRVYVARKEWTDAVKPLQEAYKLEPGNADVMFDIGLCAAKLQDKKSAEQWFVKSGKVKASAETFHQLGLLYFDLNKPKELVTALTTATRLAEEQEKQSGKTVEWLTDDYAVLGQAYRNALHNDCAAKHPLEQHLARNPPDSARTQEIRAALATSLKSCR